ncbi:MAG: type II secretion system F family protein, partial [Candidatus Margulisiibacteriota bacterium]
MTLLIVVLIFITVLVALVALFYQDPNKAQLQERMDTVLTKQRTPAEKIALAKKKMQEKRKEPSLLLTWLSGNFEKYASRFLPSTVLKNLEGKILMAGYHDVKETDIMAVKGALPFLAVILAIFLFSPQGKLLTFAVAGQSLFLTLVMVTVAFFLPDLFLSQKVKQRQKEIFKALPFAIDVIKICVEAGMDLEGAFARLVTKSKGPLVEELERVLYEVRMGKERVIALADMSKRVGLADLSSFISVMIQAEKLGMSIGKVLETQSAEIRIKQSQRAREQAVKIPVLMMLP